MKVIYIYALKDPETNETRYIGRTADPSHRIYEHHQLNRLKTHTHKNKWLLSLINKGLRAKIEIIEECNELNWSEREVYWIANTPNLTNTTKGGEGEFENHKPAIKEDVRKRIGESVSKLHKEGVYNNSHAIISKKLQGVKKSNSSIYCGVRLTKNNTYLSSIRHHSKTIYLGIYKLESDAAIAYDIKAYELFGVNAKLNFPDKAGLLMPPIKTSDNKSSKYKGICLYAKKYWQATAFVAGIKYYIGNFKSEQEAYEARCKFIKEQKQCDPLYEG
jgi:predicted GIY-YIG superfamily endonuclease